MGTKNLDLNLAQLSGPIQALGLAFLVSYILIINVVLPTNPQLKGH
jgi:hypothetical protein